MLCLKFALTFALKKLHFSRESFPFALFRQFRTFSADGANCQRTGNLGFAEFASLEFAAATGLNSWRVQRPCILRLVPQSVAGIVFIFLLFGNLRENK
jgi:hypothetical protein